MHLEICPLCGIMQQPAPQNAVAACTLCGSEQPCEAVCGHNHFICESCYAQKAWEAAQPVCLVAATKNPLAIIQVIMQNPFVRMHGPEHHFITGAALLTAFKNSGGEVNWPLALEIVFARGKMVPPGACGLWGSCGAAVSAGIFISLAAGASPVSNYERGLANLATSQSLLAISAFGGPRCCKRDSFTSICQAVDFARRWLNVDMELPSVITCDFYQRNHDCIKERCPYYRPR